MLQNYITNQHSLHFKVDTEMVMQTGKWHIMTVTWHYYLAYEYYTDNNTPACFSKKEQYTPTNKISNKKNARLLDKDSWNWWWQRHFLYDVTPHVRLDSARVWERQSADRTLKRPLTGVCSQVCTEICRLTEQSVAYITSMRLRSIVHGTPMLLQATLKFESGWAVWTQVGILVTVHLAHVARQHRRQLEPFSALRARKRSLVRVLENDVPAQQAGPLETDSALTAHVWSEVIVDFLVRVSRARLCKGFAANPARIRSFSRVASHMLGKCRSERAPAPTHVAHKPFIFTTVVFAHVLIEEFQLPILLIAFGARVPFRPMGGVLVMS